MYKNVELRNKNLEGLKENVNVMFEEFVEKTQEQYENGSLYLTAEVEMNYNLENYVKMSCEEFELFCDTTLKTVIELLNNKFCEEEHFKNYSVAENFKNNSLGKIEKITLIIKATLRS
jgi:hypothetical protein